MKPQHVLVLLILSAVLISGCVSPEEAELPNPAAVYCVEQGGDSLGILTPLGTRGYCVLSDGRRCEQWPYFNSKGEECIELVIDFSNDDECQFACTEDGYDDGNCMWPSEAELALEGETLQALKGTCLVEQSRHCGNPGQCYCYCYETAISEEYCRKVNTTEQMSLTEATRIALASECVENGTFRDTYFCNEDTGTWWLDLDIEKPGCNPACVIDVVTGEASINWRCMGLM